jgi:flagellar biosynthetic protein FliP
MRRALRVMSATTLTWYFSAGDAAAQSVSVDLGAGGTVTGQLVRLVLLITVLSLAPSILVMITSFTRVVVVLAFLRSALGLQQTPPNAVLISLALFITAFIMAPTLEQAYRDGLAPLLKEDIDEMAGFERAMAPFRTFMLAQVRGKDLISELRRAFEIGFLIFVPFLVIDMVVASILMSMGMMMLPPVLISMPFKLIFFVLVDGWYLVVGSLVESFAP